MKKKCIKKWVSLLHVNFKVENRGVLNIDKGPYDAIWNCNERLALGDGRSTNPANTFITHTSTLFLRLRHGFNLFADITLKLWQKRQIGSCIMNPASDEWRVSSSIDISIKYFLCRFRPLNLGCYNLNVVVATCTMLTLKMCWNNTLRFFLETRHISYTISIWYRTRRITHPPITNNCQ